MAGMFNLVTFRRIVSAALWTGILAGLLLTAVQSIQVIPTLLKAEAYEEKAAAGVLSGHTHSSAEEGSDHRHDQDAWKPTNGWERTFFTAASNISLAVGFALLLGGAICFRGGVSSWRAGLLWGLAGYAVFFVAPSLGLPPEVPGTELARLADRQLWWLMTVLATGAGLSLLVFAQTGISKMVGGVLLVVPHLIGVPQPQIHGSPAPVGLAHTFIYATALANAVFWLTMGGLMGLFYKKWRNSNSG